MTRRLCAGRAFLGQGQIGRAASNAEEISKIIKDQSLPTEFIDFRLLLEAEISLAQNKPEEALGVLEQTGFHAWQTSPYYWRAKAAAEEAQSRWECVAECYRKFLERMRAADHGIPEVAGAQKRLAVLK